MAEVNEDLVDQVVKGYQDGDLSGGELGGKLLEAGVPKSLVDQVLRHHRIAVSAVRFAQVMHAPYEALTKAVSE